MTDLEPIRAANRARNALLVKKFTSNNNPFPFQYDVGLVAPALADMLEEIARQWRERGSQLVEQRRKGAKGTDEKLQYAASELAGIAVSLRNDGLPDVYEQMSPAARLLADPPATGDAEQVLSFLKGDSDTLPPLPPVERTLCGIVEEISGATCARDPHEIGTNHAGDGMIWPDRRMVAPLRHYYVADQSDTACTFQSGPNAAECGRPRGDTAIHEDLRANANLVGLAILEGVEPEISLNSRIFARGPRADDATDPGMASVWDEMQPPPHVYVDGHSGMACVYLFELDGVGEECGRPPGHATHGVRENLRADVCECRPDAKEYCHSAVCRGGSQLLSEERKQATQNSGSSMLPAGSDPFSEPAKPAAYAPWKPTPKPRPFFPDASDLGPAPDHVSISQIQSECGLQLRLQKRDGVAEQPWWANVAGTALHECIDRVERQRLDESSELLVHVLSGEAQACLELFSTVLDHTMADETQASGFEPEQWRAAKKGTEGEQWWREEGPRMLQDYVAWSNGMHAAGWRVLQLPQGGPALELAFRIDLGTGLPLEGRMDQVWTRNENGRLKVLIADPKSGAHIPDRFQLGGYGHALARILKEQLGMSPGVNYDLTAAYYNARTGALEEQFNPLDEVSMEELAYRAGATSGMHTAGIYPANPKAEYGGPCGVCGVRYACPIMALKS